MSEASGRTGAALPERMEELKQRLAATLEERVRALRDQLDEDLRHRAEHLHRALDTLVAELPASVLSEEEVARFAAAAPEPSDRPDDTASRLLAAVDELEDAGTQSELLDALLRAGRGFASRTAFLLTRPDTVAGWAGHGFDDQTAAVPDVRLPYEAGTAWGQLEEEGTRGSVELEAKDRARFAAALGVPVADHAVLVPFRLRQRLAGVLYADRHNGGALDADALGVLTRTAAKTLETLGLRAAETAETAEPEAEATESAEATEAADRFDATAAAAAAVAATAEPEDPDAMVADATGFELAPEEAAAEPPLAAEPEERDELPADDTVTDFDLDDDLYEPETLELETAGLEAPEAELEAAAEDLWADEGDQTVSTELATEAGTESTAEIGTETFPAPPAAPDPGVGQKTVTLELDSLRPGDMATRETPIQAPASVDQAASAPAVEAPDFELDRPGVSPPPPPPTPVGIGSAVTEEMQRPRVLDPSEDPTLIASRGTVSAPPPPPPSTEIPKPSPTPQPAPDLDATRASSSEVVPPDDIVGPGSAFAAAQPAEGVIPDGEEALHEEARRLARLLVSEIKLYNEELIEEGRRDGNIYARLKEDIDRSRQMYEERIDPRVRATQDYFVRELEERLAGGDPAVLGLS